METKKLKLLTSASWDIDELNKIFGDDKLVNWLYPLDEFGNEINEFNPETEYLEITVKRISK